MIGGRSDSDYSAWNMSKIIVSGYAVYLEGVSILVKSAIHKKVELSATE